MEASDEAQARCLMCGSGGRKLIGEQGGELCEDCYGIICRAIEEEEEELYSEGEDAVPDLSCMPIGEGGGSITTTQEAPGRGGVHCGAGGTSIGGSAPSCVPEAERPNKRHCTGLSGSEGPQGTEFSWGLPKLQDPQIGTTILHEGKQLHLQHGPDGGEDGGMETCESISSGGEDSGSDEAFGDEGMFPDPDEVHNRAMWDTWRQTVFDVQAWDDGLSLFSIVSDY